ncbi:hypothetical protein PENTCL1PPCAC_16386, partial [Pristionchus entomophagus]
RFINELDELLESFATNFFFSIGSVSSVLSISTFYLLAKNGSFLSSEIRILLLILQISAFLNNFHFCILFVPFIYPYLGGGYCNGILCSLGLRFHYGMCFWLLTVMILSSSFIVLLFARFQTLLHPLSKLRLRPSKRLAFYIYTFSSMVVIPILFFFTDTPIEIQEWIINVRMQLDWIADKKVFAVFNGRSIIVLAHFIIYSMLGNIIVFGTITIILFIVMMHAILTSNVNRMSNHAHSAHRAKVKNSIVVLSQGVLPLCFEVATIGIGVSPETESIPFSILNCYLKDSEMVLMSELCTTFLSPLNSIIFIFGNKQYG